MSTTQSEDPNERVEHPRHYNQHPSGIECIEIVEHLSANLANATKYVWRCGLKSSETPLRDLKSAQWYVERESCRIDLFELLDVPKPKTEVVWRALAHRLLGKSNPTELLSEFLVALLSEDFGEMLAILEDAIAPLEKRIETFGHTGPIADEPTMDDP
jgi:hypothetical protein